MPAPLQSPLLRIASALTLNFELRETSHVENLIDKNFLGLGPEVDSQIGQCDLTLLHATLPHLNLFQLHRVLLATQSHLQFQHQRLISIELNHLPINATLNL